MSTSELVPHRPTEMVQLTREVGPEFVHEVAPTTLQDRVDNILGRRDVHTETRKVSSVVVEQKYLGEIPQQDGIRYVEVPTIEEEVTYVTRKEVREKIVEVKVPVVEYVDMIVNVPRIEYKDVIQEVPTVKEVFVDKVVQRYVDRPVERIVEVPVMKEKIVERVVEVPQVVEVPKYLPVEVPVDVYQRVDTEVPVIVAQTIKPMIIETSKQLLVDVMDYEPEVVPVDVHVAKPVSSALELVGQTQSRHRLVNISSAQYNSIMRQLNSHMDEKFKHTLPFVSDRNQVHFVDEQNLAYIIAPENISIEGYVRKDRMSRPMNAPCLVSGTAQTQTGHVPSAKIIPTSSAGTMYTAIGSELTYQATGTVVRESQTTDTATASAGPLRPHVSAAYPPSIPPPNFQTTVGATPFRPGVTAP